VLNSPACGWSWPRSGMPEPALPARGARQAASPQRRGDASAASLIARRKERWLSCWCATLIWR
jgi:hypothetical protein